MSTLTRHCHRCGTNFLLNGNPGRLETCEKCGADLKVCLNCVHYDRGVAHECRERRADPVADKIMANFCEHFDFKRRVFAANTEGKSREEKARDDLKKTTGGLSLHFSQFDRLPVKQPK